MGWILRSRADDIQQPRLLYIKQRLAIKRQRQAHKDLCLTRSKAKQSKTKSRALRCQASFNCNFLHINRISASHSQHQHRHGTPHIRGTMADGSGLAGPLFLNRCPLGLAANSRFCPFALFVFTMPNERQSTDDARGSIMDHG